MAKQIKTSLVEMVLYLWLKKLFKGVIHRGTIEGLEYHILVEDIKLAILITTKVELSTIEQKKEETLFRNGYSLLRVINFENTEDAFLEKRLDSGNFNLIYNQNYDPYCISQVLPLVQNYIKEVFEKEITIEGMVDEELIIKAFSNVYKVRYSESFAGNYRELAKSWDTSGNYGVKPEQISEKCPIPFKFKCQHCENIFVSTIENLVGSGCCTCCKKSLFESNSEGPVRIDDMTGKHDNIDYFIINGQEERCTYADLIFTVLDTAVKNGKVSGLIENKIIEVMKSKKRCNYMSGIYKFNIPDGLERQYDLLIDVMLILGIEYDVIHVKLKQNKFISGNIETKLVDIEKEIFNTCGVEDMRIMSPYDRSSRKDNMRIEQAEILRKSFDIQTLDCLMRNQYHSSYDYMRAQWYLGIPNIV